VDEIERLRGVRGGGFIEPSPSTLTRRSRHGPRSEQEPGGVRVTATTRRTQHPPHRLARPSSGICASGQRVLFVMPMHVEQQFGRADTEHRARAMSESQWASCPIRPKPTAVAAVYAGILAYQALSKYSLTPAAPAKTGVAWPDGNEVPPLKKSVWPL
jgi:hypothetical protein